MKVEGWRATVELEPTTEESACIDRWLASRGLDPYGSPAGTQYAGGTPLFDPVTGETISRAEYVMVRHADAIRQCQTKKGATP